MKRGKQKHVLNFIWFVLIINYNIPELEPPSASQCDIPSSDALKELEVPPQRGLVKCSEELPSDDKAVKPSIGVGWWWDIAADAPLLADELCLGIWPLPAKIADELWCWYRWLLLYRLLLNVVIVCEGVDAETSVGGVNADEDDDKFNPPIIDGEFCCCEATKCR